MPLYHINPITGIPGVCHAQKGQCPYGSLGQHYNSYESAQEDADKIATQRFVDYEELNKDDKEKYTFNDNKYSYLNNMDKEKVLQEIKSSTDRDLLASVINRKVLSERGAEDNSYVDAALTNDNMPIEYIENIQDNPSAYSKHTLIAFENNPQLSSYEKVELIKGAPNDGIFCQQITENPNVKGEAIKEILDDMKGANENNWPPRTSNLVANPNCPKDVFNEWTKTGLYSSFIAKITTNN